MEGITPVLNRPSWYFWLLSKVGEYQREGIADMIGLIWSAVCRSEVISLVLSHCCKNNPSA